jgi:hypothetical protein
MRTQEFMTTGASSERRRIRRRPLRPAGARQMDERVEVAS